MHPPASLRNIKYGNRPSRESYEKYITKCMTTTETLDFHGGTNYEKPFVYKHNIDHCK